MSDVTDKISAEESEVAVAANDTVPSDTTYKTKLLEEFTDVSCMGTGGWLAWVCKL